MNAILEVHKRYNELVTNAFRSDPGFVQAMDKALASFVNNNQITENAKSTSKSPELLARCCDLLLRKSSKNPEDRELEYLLSQVVRVSAFCKTINIFFRSLCSNICTIRMSSRSSIQKCWLNVWSTNCLPVTKANPS